MTEKRVKAREIDYRGHNDDTEDVLHVIVPAYMSLPDEFEIVWDEPEPEPEPSPHQCEGLDRYSLAIYCHDGEWSVRAYGSGTRALIGVHSCPYCDWTPEPAEWVRFEDVQQGAIFEGGSGCHYVKRTWCDAVSRISGAVVWFDSDTRAKVIQPPQDAAK